MMQKAHTYVNDLVPKETNIPYTRERGPTTEYRPTPHFWLNLLLRSNVYLNVRPCVAVLENAAQMAGDED